MSIEYEGRNLEDEERINHWENTVWFPADIICQYFIHLFNIKKKKEHVTVMQRR